jgi:radical SAM superfamily enzyme YgiQ (UPF0313 family)
MRDAVNKNLTTQQILESFEIAMKVGFNKIKIYMIANLPFERQIDIDGTPQDIYGADAEIEVYDSNDEANQTFDVEFEDGSHKVLSKQELEEL